MTITDKNICNLSGGTPTVCFKQWDYGVWKPTGSWQDRSTPTNSTVKVVSHQTLDILFAPNYLAFGNSGSFSPFNGPKLYKIKF